MEVRTLPGMSTHGGRSRRVDVVILTAIPLEYEAALQVSAGAVEGSQWEEERRPNGLRVSFRSFHGKKGARPLRVALALAGGMGAVEATSALLPLVEEYHPRCVAMCGVCAGRPGKTNLGDVIAPDRLFFHDTGKLRPEGTQQDLTTYNLRYDWKEDLKHFDFLKQLKGEAWWNNRPVPYEWQENWALLKLHEGVSKPWTLPECEQYCPHWEKIVDALVKSAHVSDSGELTDEGRKRVKALLFRHKGRLPDLSPTGELFPFRVHLEPMGSGSQVIEDVAYWGEVTEYMRKALGLEMEAAAIGAMAYTQPHRKLDALVMKSVMDFANSGRDDHFKKYAARTSAECLMAFLREHLDPEVVPGVDDLLSTGSIGEPPESAPPSALLNAHHEVVPFHGREPLLAELDQWCDEGPSVAVRLLHAEGGAGKTRVAIEWIRRRRELGWAAGFLPESVSRNAAQDWLEQLWSLGQPLLVVIDYAESHPRLHEMLSRLHRYAQQGAEGLRSIRLLLLARNNGDWWKSLRERDSSLATWLDSMPVRQLPSLSNSLADRVLVFHEAAKRFAEKLSKTYVRRPVETLLGDECFNRLLYVHMAALASVEGLAFEPNTLMDVILDHEEHFWEVRAGQAHVGHAVQRSLARQVVAAATLRGGFPEKEEAELVIGRLLRRPTTENDAILLRLLHWVYQRSAESPALFLPPLEPDLLGEAMVLRVASFSPSSDERVPSDWIDRVFSSNEREQVVGTGLRVLGRVSAVSPALTRPWIERFLAGSLLDARAVLTLEAALAVGQRTAFSVLGDVLADRLEVAGTIEQARRLDAVGIPFPTVSLDRVAEWTARMRLQVLPTPPSDKVGAERAGLLGNWGTRLRALGRRREALTATEEAVSLHRGLAARNPDAFQPALAISLNNLGSMLSALGRRQEALTAVEEAVSLYRVLAARNPDAFQPVLATSLNNLGTMLSALGQRQAALTATEEAVSLRRGLVARNPDAFQADRAMSVNNLGTMLSALGQRQAALTATEEAVSLYRSLATRNPDAFQPDLAMSLHNLGTMLSALGQWKEALTATEEAVSLRRGLAARNPDAFQPNLATSLNNLGSMLSALGQRQAALTAIEEAVSLYRSLVARNPDAFQPDLAMSLHNLGAMLSALGQRQEALTATEEAVSLYRVLAARNADAFRPNLATSLNNLGTMLSALGQRQAALTATEEAVSLRRGLAARNPDAFQPDLAMSLHNLGTIQSALGRWQEALTAVEEAVSLFRGLAARNPDAFQPNLATSLDNLGTMLSAPGQWKEALTATEEAVSLRQGLAARNPDAFQPDLATSLNNLGNRLSDLGRREEAVLAVIGAIETLWPFFLRFPKPLEHNTGVMLAHVKQLHEHLQRPIPSELQERIDTFKRLTKS
ncbi:tetratricopeptide repeat protein [Pyxidicoccus caerfyrddinensis]|uniref:tetratricopeptide repeat protein n=1 Tax=Pyxidicoccus caerfyrddinensis TaxID=2709663 RepID=UPI001966FDBB|nr:tetratricopeptide repeat protein [Pyxidicoccus caerfyrddinensis]